MEKQDIDLIKSFINDHGPVDALEVFHAAMREYADEASDLGLKELAHTASDIAHSLDYLHDASKS